MVDWKRSLKKLSKRLRAPLIILSGAAAITAVLLNLEFNLLEANLYDFRMSRGFQAKPSKKIVLITLDDASVKALDDFSPLPLDFHARFLEKLEGMNPRAVGYLVDMNRVNQLNPELFRGEWGRRFVQAAERLESRGIPLVLGTPFDVTGEVLPPYPLSSLPHSVAIIHKDGNVFAEDKVTRRALTYLNGAPVFHLDLAQRLGMSRVGGSVRGGFKVREIDGEYVFFRYHGPTQRWGDNEPYARISFRDLLEGTVPPSLLADKIVLVGTMTREDSADYVLTPYSKAAFANPKLLVHANILDSLVQDDGVIRAPNWLNWVTTFSMTTFVLWWVLNLTPLYGVLFTFALALSFGLFAHSLFQLKGLWLRESQPLVGIFLGYYLAVPYRLILEYKKRWDYQRRNELLTQVEELKTNFLSLVTHDLKTPVARIQGLAEVLLRKASERLVERDKETIQHIIGSTDELNRFISSILELNKIESNRIQLNLESRDVNQLVERSVEGFKAQARARGQKILVNLEPLFPIKVDVALISKVLNNLIDNALKYSPPGCEVTVESRELGEMVEISIRDTGIGMSEEERCNLFTRFYRAKNDTTVKIPGTGLGLYLTRYFIELHQGQVLVESEKGAGSAFRIRLPISGGVSPQDAGGPMARIRERTRNVIPGLRHNAKRLLKRTASSEDADAIVEMVVEEEKPHV